MRTHGWGGSPPASDEEAVARIKEMTHRCVEEMGGRTRIVHVAAGLGISRQTVYRYFPGTAALLAAAALDGTRPFLARLARRLKKIDDPGEALVETVVHTVQSIPDEPYLRLLLETSGPGSLLQGVTSDTARAIGREVLDRAGVDWEAAGIGAERRDELIEWALRVIQSFLLDPGTPARTAEELRAFLRRWLAPGVGAAMTRADGGTKTAS